MLTQEKELSCEEVIGGIVVDTGVSVSLLREKEYKGLKNRGGMHKSDIEITQVDGTPMKIRAMVKLLVKIGRTKSVQKIYITLIYARKQLYEKIGFVTMSPA